jgi:hypothetical protein
MRSLWRDREGSALVEGAILLPVLMILMFGIYEFSWLLYQQHVMVTGLVDAARHLARSASPCNATSQTWAADEAAARSLAATGTAGSGTARIKGWAPGMVAIACLPVDNPAGSDGLRSYRGGPFVYVVTVSSRLTDPSLGFFRLLGLEPPAISVSHSERVTGPG